MIYRYGKRYIDIFDVSNHHYYEVSAVTVIIKHDIDRESGANEVDNVTDNVLFCCSLRMCLSVL